MNEKSVSERQRESTLFANILVNSEQPFSFEIDGRHPNNIQFIHKYTCFIINAS